MVETREPLEPLVLERRARAVGKGRNPIYRVLRVGVLGLGALAVLMFIVSIIMTSGYLRYTKRITNVNKFNPLFVHAVASLLALLALVTLAAKALLESRYGDELASKAPR